jgi:predicted nucleic acid-binding protein
MRFLPDSAVLGTLGRIKHASKKNLKGRAVSEEQVLAQSWEAFRVDSRSLEELLADAKKNKEKQHAE